MTHPVYISTTSLEVPWLPRRCVSSDSVLGYSFLVSTFRKSFLTDCIQLVLDLPLIGTCLVALSKGNRNTRPNQLNLHDLIMFVMQGSLYSSWFLVWSSFPEIPYLLTSKYWLTLFSPIYLAYVFLFCLELDLENFVHSIYIFKHYKHGTKRSIPWNISWYKKEKVWSFLVSQFITWILSAFPTL